jgi:DNA-binding transcriptional LysR family regulator
MYDWNDLKAFLAVARGGSTLAGAKALNVNQTTVARRVESLEGALGLKLFERGQSGSRPTEAGRDLVGEAEKVERAAEALASRAQAHQRGLAGAIKITCVEILANSIITPAIGEFRKLYPEVQIDLMITDRRLDIEAGEADLAVRAGVALGDSDLVARKLAEFEFALYCSRDYAARKGRPATLADLRDHDLIGVDPSMDGLPGIAWMFQHAGGAAPVHRSNSMTNLVHAVRAGLGIAPLGCLLADADTHLLRCSDISDDKADAWLVTRRELKDTPRMRAFIDFLVPYVQQEMKSRIARNRIIRARMDEEPESLPAEDAGAPVI